MFKKIILKYWPILAIIAVIFAFFSKLFFPELSIYITPDYGRSDLMHFNTPLRKTVSDSLKNFELPLWEPNIGQGFPIFDEGQIGLFYIPNLLLFGLFPFWIAFNLGYIVTFLIAALGTYLLSRSLGLNKAGSYLAGITYSFSPLIVLHLHHYNLIQTVALAPWLFWLTNSFFNTRKIIYLISIPLVLSQQLFVGFAQITLYSLTGLLIFFIFKILTTQKRGAFRRKITSIFLLTLITGFLIASVQLIATYTLLQESGKLTRQSPKDILTDFPFKFKNILTVIDPYILGSPVDASYPRWDPGRWGIFWESSLYFGVTQLVLLISLITVLFFKRFTKSRLQGIFFWLFLGFLGLTLTLGTEAPLHPLFSVPPYSYFRVPARFLILTFLSISILVSYAITRISISYKEKLSAAIILIILGFATLDIFRSWSGYHLTSPVKQMTTNPEILEGINETGRVFTIGEFSAWNSVFLTEGWQNAQADYIFFRNFISPNSNLLLNIPHSEVYAAMITNRQTAIGNLLTNLINEATQVNESEQGHFTFNAPLQKILDFNSVKYVISSNQIESENLSLLKQLDFKNNSVFLYENESVMPQAFIVTDYKVARTIPEFQNIIQEESFDPKTTVIIEKDQPSIERRGIDNSSLSIKEYKKNYVKIEANLAEKSILVLSDSYYPGWKTYVDNKETELFPANINSRAILVPKGKHQIEYVYDSDLLKLGGLISAVSIFSILVIILKSRKSGIIA